MNGIKRYKLISDENSVKVLKSPFFAVIIYVSIMIATALFGVFFIYLIDHSPAVLRYIGYIAVTISLIMLVFLPGYLRKLKKEGGDFIFEANNKGIRIVPEWLQGTTIWGNSLPYVELTWDQIERIVFVRWFSERLLGKRTSWWNKMIIFVKDTGKVPFTRKLYQFNRKSPDGRTVLLASYSSDYVNSLSYFVERFSKGKIRPVEYEEVMFDYNNKEVEYLNECSGF